MALGMNRDEQRERLATRNPREVISKSFVTGADMCGERAWRDLNHPRPFLMSAPVLFGRAVDAGVSVMIDSNNRTGSPDMALAKHAADVELAEHDEDLWPEFGEVDAALEAFLGVMQRIDLADAVVQPYMRVDIEGIPMPADCHPDIITIDDRILDIKTSKRSKDAAAARNSYGELGLYALAFLAHTGRMPPSVGYLTWVRGRQPYWQLIEAEVTPQFLERARAKVLRVVDAIRTDTRVNSGKEVPANVSFPNGPAFLGLCGNCAHAPQNGGGCVIAEEEV